MQILELRIVRALECCGVGVHQLVRESIIKSWRVVPLSESWRVRFRARNGN